MYTRIAHAIAGILILSSLFLGIKVNENWFWLTGFVGVNLLQNAFTNWCLIYVVLHKLGIRDEGKSCTR
jgi:hypothetical protein